MSKIISERQRIENVTYGLYFANLNVEGAGFSFDCDKDGNVDTASMNPCALANYNGCISGEYNVKLVGVETYTSRYTQPAILKCDCGEHVHLDSSWANECDGCGAEYNMSGQRLAPRSQWGEETGESFY